MKNQMTTFRKISCNWRRVLFLLPLFFILIIACSQAASNRTDATAQNHSASSASIANLTPSIQEKSIAHAFCLILQSRHVTKNKIDQTTSERAFGLFFKSIDPMKLYFTRADVDQFEKKYKEQFAIMATKKNLTAPYEIYRCFIERVQERCHLAHQILETPLDFSVDEYYIRDKDKLDYPKTPEEVRARWTQKMKFELLSLEADAQDKAKEEAEKDKEEKEKSKDSQSSKEVKKETSSPAETAKNEGTPDPDDKPVPKLHRRYNGLEKRIKQVSKDKVLEIYLNSIANSYDPHSNYMSPKTFEIFMTQMRLNLEGIGATLGWEDGYTIVKDLLKGGPAEKQGELETDDRIIGVAQGKDGSFDDVVDMSLTDVIAKIRGKKGTLVRLEVRKAKGKGRKIIPIIREKIELDDSAAQGKIFEVGQKRDGSPYKVGVIDLPSFYFDMQALERGDTTGRSTTRDVRKILVDFRSKKVDACMIDLRSNGGGSLQEVVNLTGLFIKTGPVVQVKPANIDPNKARALEDSDPSVDWAGPLVVVTSKFSASASEIFAGAIKDYKRGLIVGDETTHGKGTVQPLIEIANPIFGDYIKAPKFGTIKVTIQGFYLPDGQSTQLTGVPSDIQLPSLTNYFDGTEADSDYPLKFEKIQPAKNYPVFKYVTPEIVSKLNAQSKARIDKPGEWDKIKKNIAAYREIKELKKTPLNRTKYFEQLDRFNSDKEEKDEYKRLQGSENDKIKRNYYMNELLNITVDYLNLLQELRVVFQDEGAVATN